MESEETGTPTSGVLSSLGVFVLVFSLSKVGEKEVRTEIIRYIQGKRRKGKVKKRKVRIFVLTVKKVSGSSQS